MTTKLLSRLFEQHLSGALPADESDVLMNYIDQTASDEELESLLQMAWENTSEQAVYEPAKAREILDRIIAAGRQDTNRLIRGS